MFLVADLHSTGRRMKSKNKSIKTSITATVGGSHQAIVKKKRQIVRSQYGPTTADPNCQSLKLWAAAAQPPNDRHRSRKAHSRVEERFYKPWWSCILRRGLDVWRTAGRPAPRINTSRGSCARPRESASAIQEIHAVTRAGLGAGLPTHVR